MERFKLAKKVSILGMIGNVFLLVIKSIIAFITRSQAMIADSVHSAGDIFSSLMTFIGNKIACKPKDDDHNLGHGKAEYIFALFISVSMILVSIKLFQNSIISLIDKREYIFSWWLIIVCSITIAVKMTLYLYTNFIAKKHNNFLVVANVQDHKNDCILTFFNLVSVIFAANGVFWFDGVVGILIAVWILFESIKILRESYNVLMDKAICDEDKQRVLDIVKSFPEVKKVEHFNSTPVGYKYQISFTILLDGNMTTFESHDIANKIEKEIDKLDEIYLTVVHVNPI